MSYIYLLVGVAILCNKIILSDVIVAIEVSALCYLPKTSTKKAVTVEQYLLGVQPVSIKINK